MSKPLIQKRTNLNYYIKVKLNEKGKKILQDEIDQMNKLWFDKFEVQKPEEDGYYKFQMWEFMEKFGEHTGMGFDQPFETEVIIEVYDE